MLLLRHLFLLFFVAVALTGALTSACRKAPPSFECTDPIGCIEIGPEEPLKFAVLQPLSGTLAAPGAEQLRAVELAMAREKNRFLGHPIELLVEDEHCSAEGGTISTLHIVADPQVIGIFGPSCSGTAITAGKIMSEAGLVMISGANTASSLTSIGGKRGEHSVPGYYRTTWNDSDLGRAAAAFAAGELKLERAAITHAGEPFSEDLADSFAAAFTDLGGEIVQESVIGYEDTDQRPMLDAVALSGAQLLFFPVCRGETCKRILRQAREMPRLVELVLIAAEGTGSDAFLAAAGSARRGVYHVGPAVPRTPGIEKLRLAYRREYGGIPSAIYYAFAYDAVSLLLHAIEKVADLEEDGSLHIGRQALREALYATRGFEGVSGTLSCDEFGNCGIVKIDVLFVESPPEAPGALREKVVFSYRCEK